MKYKFGYSWMKHFYGCDMLSMKCCNPQGCDGTFITTYDCVGREPYAQNNTIIHNVCDSCSYHIREFERSQIFNDNDIQSINVVVFYVNDSLQEYDTFLGIYNVVLNT
jgi:hypothetical protein